MQADSGGILITGATGQVGEALTRTLSPFARLICPTHEEMDLANPAAIRQLMREVRPRWIVNAAAYTAVDKAESEPSVAFTLNATAPSVLAEEAAAIGAPLIHFSTDYVFDGTKSAPYVESDLTGPLNTYGCTKLAGEAAISGSTDAYFIFRTSWVYGVTGHNFLRSILRLARQRETLSIVNDQHGGPTWSFELARMTAHMIQHVEQLAIGSTVQQAAVPLSGIYHASGSGETTWFGFASAAVAHLRALEPNTRLATILPIPTTQYPTPARRPLNSLLDCSKLQQAFGWTMPDWRQSLAQVFAESAHSL
jgi:dTDP-4-dehydrorhamnose reductase